MWMCEKLSRGKNHTKQIAQCYTYMLKGKRRGGTRVKSGKGRKANREAGSSARSEDGASSNAISEVGKRAGHHRRFDRECARSAAAITSVEHQ